MILGFLRLEMDCIRSMLSRVSSISNFVPLHARVLLGDLWGKAEALMPISPRQTKTATGQRMLGRCSKKLL